MRIRNALGAFLVSAVGTYAFAAATPAEAASVRMHGSSCYLASGALNDSGRYGMWSYGNSTLVCPYTETSDLGHASVTELKVYGHRENGGDSYSTTVKG